MFSFKTFKDIRYWILLVPTVILLLVLGLFTSNRYLFGSLNLFVLLMLGVVILFWTTYHLWKYVGDKRGKQLKLIQKKEKDDGK